MADNDEDFGAMLAEFETGKPKADKRRPRAGDMIKGTVISVGQTAVFVDVGGKAEGVLDRGQVSDAEGKLLVKVGDVVEARVSDDAGGVLTLRVKLGGRGPEVRAELQQAHELGIPVEGVVTEVIKGGVSVDVAGVRGFCPASQVDARFVEDLGVYVGQRLTFRITRYEPRNLVLSRRALVEEEREKLAIETRKKLVPGAVLRGVVVGFKPFGAFIDLGGIEGMLHVSELGYARVDRPEDILRLGQEVDVAVLKVEPVQDKGKLTERISLSLKALASDPWREATASLAEGQRIKGRITRLQPFGAFVEIVLAGRSESGPLHSRPAVEGLVHISELGANRRINHPKEVVEVGQEIEAVVLSIDLDKRRLSLSMAASKDATSDDVAEAVKSQPPAKLGTFADLLQKKK